MDVPPALTRHRRDVQAFLRQLLDRPGTPLLYSMARYHLGWEDERGNPTDAGGKGLRAGLCLLACEASGGDWKTALPTSGAVELVHSFSLVHDDIQDRDRERHHRPAVWTVWGEAQAINAGDALLALGRLALDDFARLGGSPDTVVRLSRCLDEATLEMVEGQVWDLEFESRDSVKVDEYLDMVGRKTGALFGCALSLGAIVAGAGDERLDQFARLGRTLGIAFQVRDDMLGIWGDEEKTGKPAGADLQRRKKSLPVVVALNGSAGLEVRSAFAAPGDLEIETLIGAMERAGVSDECRRIGAKFQQGALDQIARLNFDGEAGSEFAEAVVFLLEREY